jgi:hypothetical protein
MMLSFIYSSEKFCDALQKNAEIFLTADGLGGSAATEVQPAKHANERK